jgi:hypothetical protein
MRSINMLATALMAVAVPLGASATVGGSNYATQYDFNEFRAAHDGKTLQVVWEGNPFPNRPAGEVARQLLPVMQANRMPRVNLTFTFDRPAGEPHPYYRLVLVFNAANDFGSASACNDRPRFKPGTSGQVNVFAVYCRNDLALSETTAWTTATGPDDPRVGAMFKDLFMTVFSDAPSLTPGHSPIQFQ